LLLKIEKKSNCPYTNYVISFGLQKIVSRILIILNIYLFISPGYLNLPTMVIVMPDFG